MKTSVRLIAALFVVVSLGFMTVAYSSTGLPEAIGGCVCAV